MVLKNEMHMWIFQIIEGLPHLSITFKFSLQDLFSL